MFNLSINQEQPEHGKDDIHAHEAEQRKPSAAGTHAWGSSMDGAHQAVNQPGLAVIDSRTNKLDRWITLAGTGYGTAPTADGKWLLVAMPSANKVAVVELATLQVSRTIDVPPAPQEVLVRPDGQVAYVSCDRSAKVAAIRMRDWSVQLVEAGSVADGLAWAR